MKKNAIRLQRLQSRIDTAKKVLYSDYNAKRSLFEVIQELRNKPIVRGVYANG